MVALPVQPVDVHVAPLSVVRKSPPDAKLREAATIKVCGFVDEAHSLGFWKNAGRPLEDSNQDAPPSVDRSAPPVPSPERLVQEASIFWSVPSSMISRSVTLSIVPCALSKTLLQLSPASVLRQIVASNPATPKSAPPSIISSGLF
jgi:hypothetical protein